MHYSQEPSTVTAQVSGRDSASGSVGQLSLLQTQSLLADEDFINFLIEAPTERLRYVEAINV